ncbi:MAG: diguanylate cyclase [Pseudomonadota bacterium]
MSDSFVLCVDDDAAVLNALRTLLSQALGPGHVVEIAESGEEALEIEQELRAQGHELSVVISDYIMPGIRGDELLARLHQASPNTVKILLTGQSELDGIKRANNEANLFQFLEKPFDNIDVVDSARNASLTYAHGRARASTGAQLLRANAELDRQVCARDAELARMEAELARLDAIDPLTGLSNRPHLEDLLAQRSAQGDCALLLLDVDDFKSVNERFGHHAGDAVLVALAALLAAQARAGDVLGRWEGQQFLLLAAGSALAPAQALAEALRAGVAAHRFDGVGHTTASVGVSAMRAGESGQSMLARAELALQRAKQGGRNRVHAEP